MESCNCYECTMRKVSMYNLQNEGNEVPLPKTPPGSPPRGFCQRQPPSPELSPLHQMALQWRPFSPPWMLVERPPTPLFRSPTPQPKREPESPPPFIQLGTPPRSPTPVEWLPTTPPGSPPRCRSPIPRAQSPEPRVEEREPAGPPPEAQPPPAHGRRRCHRRRRVTLNLTLNFIFNNQ
ncbi:leucine-rich repeat extensin-like protein 3 [Leptopilina heterotoma]|uniref:leucine-rich repeat extensin-like protein 3 n=1 Tax=Leptopilina heterotoma TaxID=63436 RepID=UPI001CA85CA2|nr:leucine-rich repeat extensin-like protein 3 [Leptopilina heterotoma]